MEKEKRAQLEDLFNTTSLLLAEHGQIPPIYFIDNDGQMNPVVAAEDVTVDQLASTAISVANEWNAEGVMLICEQSMLAMDKNDPGLKDYLDGVRRPSDSPDAKPALTLTYMSDAGECVSIIAEIHKSPNGIRYVDETKWIDDAATNMITPWF